MVERVQAHIKKLNWGYKVELAEKDVKYYNCLATLVNKNTIEVIKIYEIKNIRNSNFLHYFHQKF